MPITQAEILAGISSAFSDATSWARFCRRGALADDIAELEGVIAQGRAAIGKRDVAEQAWLETQTVALNALKAQLDALAPTPVVPVDDKG